MINIMSANTNVVPTTIKRGRATRVFGVIKGVYYDKVMIIDDVTNAKRYVAGKYKGRIKR